MRFLLLFPALLMAQPPGLSLREAVERALSHNPQLSALTATESATEARIIQARSGLLPKVNYTESFARSDNPVFVFSSLLVQRQFSQDNFAIGALNRPDFLNNFQSQFTADQPLFDSGQTKRAIRSAQLALQLNKEDTRLAQQRLAAATVQAYFDAQLSTAHLEAIAQAQHSAEADLAQATNRYNVGLATEADILSVKVHLAQILEQKASRQASYEVALATLNDALGLPLETQYTLSTALSELLPPGATLDGLEAQAASSRPEITQSSLANELASTQIADAKSRYLPQVYLRGAFEANRQNFVTKGGANWLVSVGLKWNLFNGGADRARIAESEANLRRQQALAQSTASQVKLEVRRAWSQLESAQTRINAARSAVEAAAESLRITQNRYGSGLATITDLLRTESALLDTRTRMLAAVHFQRLAAAQLALATATLTSDSEILQ